MKKSKIDVKDYFVTLIMVGAFLASLSSSAFGGSEPAQASSTGRTDASRLSYNPKLFPKSSNYNFGNDAVLVRFVMVTNPILSRVAAGCLDLVVKRDTFHSHFNISGFCYAKSSMQKSLNCGGYDIYAAGTIDDPVQATIRRVTLTPICGSAAIRTASLARSDMGSGGEFAPTPGQGPYFDFANDVVLTQFLMSGDPVLSQIVGACTHLAATRTASDANKHFSIAGFCYTKNNPEEDRDCPGNDINATGKIESLLQATIQKITLTLVCDSDGE